MAPNEGKWRELESEEGRQRTRSPLRGVAEEEKPEEEKEEETAAVNSEGKEDKDTGEERNPKKQKAGRPVESPTVER
eukprot:13498243-Alexandrium_andersonii.AAC.1